MNKLLEISKKKQEFAELASLRKEKYDPKTDTNCYRCIELEHIDQETGSINGFVNSKDQKSIKNIFYENDILYCKLRPYLKKYYISNFKGVCSTEFWVIKAKDAVKSNYLFYLIQTSKFNQVANISSGSKMPRADWDLVSQSLFNIHYSYVEQQKIADFLSAVDRKIELLEKQLELQQQYKRGIMQRIFSQKVRFRDDEGNQYPEWEETELSEVVERITTRNEEGNDNVLTISAQMGLVNQLLYYNRSVASKDLSNYYLLNQGDFAYNKSYSAGYPLGAFKRLDKYTKGVVSPLYICFRPQGNIDSDYLIHYFEAGMMNDPIQSIAQEGARNHGLLNVGVKDFFSLDLLCPPIEEQKKIADFLNSLDRKIEVTKTQIERAKIWKKGLLQQMFV